MDETDYGYDPLAEDATDAQDDEDTAGAAANFSVKPDFKQLLSERRSSIASAYDAAEQAIRNRYRKPGNQELLLSLASAFAKPTEGGSFRESLANVPQALLGYVQSGREREAALEDKMAELKLARATAEGAATKDVYGLMAKYANYGQPKFQQAFQDPSTGRVTGVWTTPTGEAMTQQIAQLTPQQETIGFDPKTGQVVTAPKGRPGQAVASAVPGYTPPPKEYSAGEREQLFNANTSINASTQAIRSITNAMQLNNKSYEGAFAGPGIALARLTGIGADTAKNTSMLQRAFQDQVAASLRATFGGNPTEGERNYLERMNGFAGMTRAERAAFLNEGRQLALLRIQQATNTMRGIQGGQYGARPGPAGNAPRRRVKVLGVRPAGE